MSNAGKLNAVSGWAEAQQLAPPGTSLAGWIHEDERELYFRLAQKMRPGQRFVEIGTYGGTTPCLVALVAPPGVEVIAIDSFENDTHVKGQLARGVPEDQIETLEQVCRKNIAAAGVDIELIVGSSHAVGKQWNRQIDWLVVDGDHTKTGCLEDLADFAPWVPVGGLLVVDDVNAWDTVGEATREWLAKQPSGWWAPEWEYTGTQGSTLGLRRT